jgi:signal transduction histidine kinase
VRKGRSRHAWNDQDIGVPDSVVLIRPSVRAQPALATPAQAAHPDTGPLPAASPAVDTDGFGADVLSKLGHELRSPLASIIGLTRVLLMRIHAAQADSATQVRQLGMIQASAARSLSTIERVVRLARIESGRVRPALQFADCRDVVTSVAATLQIAAADQGRRLSTDVPAHPVMLLSDPDILGQLLSELASNGLCYTHGGEVRIRVHAGEEPVIIDVCDDGPGISEHEQARIFEPFERGDLASDDGAPGLGLHLARKQAGLLGAQLSLVSQAGAGSTFTITFTNSRTQPAHGTSQDPGS